MRREGVKSDGVDDPMTTSLLNSVLGNQDDFRDDQGLHHLLHMTLQNPVHEEHPVDLHACLV